MKFTASKLFHSVVISGAALTGCAGSTAKPTAEASRAPTVDNAAATTNGNASSAVANRPGACPPGSERPYPPCYWIK